MARLEYQRLNKAMAKISEFKGLEEQDQDTASIRKQIKKLFANVPPGFRFYAGHPELLNGLQLISEYSSWKGSVLLEDPTDELKNLAVQLFGESKVFVLSGTRVNCLDSAESTPELTDSNAGFVEKSCDQVVDGSNDKKILYHLVQKRCDQLIYGFSEHSKRNNVTFETSEKLWKNLPEKMKQTVSKLSKDRKDDVDSILKAMSNLAPEEGQHHMDTQIRLLDTFIKPIVPSDDDLALTIDKKIELAFKEPLNKILKLENKLTTIIGLQQQEKVNEELVKQYSKLAVRCYETHESLQKELSDFVSSLNNMDGKQEQCKHEAEVTRCSELEIESDKQQVEMRKKLEEISSMFSSSLSCNQEVLCSIQKEFSDLKSALTFDTSSEISTLIFQKQYDEAFIAALLMHDGVILSWICSEVKLEELLPTTALSHPTLHGLLVQLSDNLPLDHNLSPDLINDTQTKLKWMILIASWIPEKVMERDRLDLEKVQKKMHKFFMEYGSSPQVSSIISESRSLDRILSYILSNKDGPSCS